MHFSGQNEAQNDSRKYWICNAVLSKSGGRASENEPSFSLEEQEDFKCNQ